MSNFEAFCRIFLNIGIYGDKSSESPISGLKIILN